MNESLDKTSKINYISCEVCANHFSYDKDSADKIKCDRCGTKHRSSKSKDNAKTFIFALTALILYVPANMLPFMTFEMYGNTTHPTIWGGIQSLADSGDLILAIVIFIASMLVPFIKLVALFYLSFSSQNGKNKIFKTKLFKFIEIIGPWSMLDVFLLAILVAVIKLDSLASVSMGYGAMMFLFVVIFTMIAAANFDTKLIWEEGE